MNRSARTRHRGTAARWSLAGFTLSLVALAGGVLVAVVIVVSKT